MRYVHHADAAARSAQMIPEIVHSRRPVGHVAEARIGLTNMGPVPVRARAAEEAVAGAEADRSALRAAAAHADEDTQPPADLHGAPDYRRHLARVLTARALAVAAGA